MIYKKKCLLQCPFTRGISMEEIYKKLAEQQNFSKNLQKITSYLYDEPKIFAIYSAAEAGKRMGVSETTVIRFCQKLGFSGYRALQAEVQQHLFQKSSLSDFIEEKSVENGDHQPLKRLMTNDLEAIQKTMEQIPEAHFETAVKKLSGTDKVLVSGVRTSHALASWFTFSLDIVIGNVRLYQPNVDDVLLRISELTNKSVVVVFSFHRYAKDTIHIAKLAREQGAFVIAFTDSPMAPIAKFANLLLPVQLKLKSTLDVAPTVMSLANAIVSAISLKNAEQFQERAERFDAVNGKDFFI